MDFLTYHEKSATTAMYPIPTLGETELGYVYPVFGLIGEYGEFMEKVSEYDPDSDMTTFSKEIAKEAGDVLWYVHAILWELSIDLTEFQQRLNDGVAIQSGWNLFITMAGTAKKAIRDLEGDFSSEYIEKVTQVLLCVYNEIQIVTHEVCDMTLDDCRQMNCDKLFSRKERGVITGDGDNR